MAADDVRDLQHGASWPDDGGAGFRLLVETLRTE